MSDATDIEIALLAPIWDRILAALGFFFLVLLLFNIRHQGGNLVWITFLGWFGDNFSDWDFGRFHETFDEFVVSGRILKCVKLCFSAFDSIEM